MQDPKNRSLCLWACLLLLGSPAASHAQFAYDITPLGSIGGGASPTALNNLGQVVGHFYSQQDQSFHAFLYSNGQIRDLFRGGNIIATGINDQGQVTGNKGAWNVGYRYDLQTQTLHDLGLGSLTLPHAINQSGNIVGEYQGAGPTHAFLYNSNTGTYQDLGILPGGGTSEAYALNNRDQVVGQASVGLQNHAFLYSNGVMQDIGLLPGGMYAQATGINDLGDVIGYSDATGIPAGDHHAFLYRNGTMQDLGTLLPTDPESRAFGINNAGDIVGDSNFRGFLYHNGKMQALDTLIDPSLGWSIAEATAINEKGQIVGFGNQGMFLMTPRIANTPAPGSLLVCGLGVGLLAVRLRRKCGAAGS